MERPAVPSMSGHAWLLLIVIKRAKVPARADTSQQISIWFFASFSPLCHGSRFTSSRSPFNAFLAIVRRSPEDFVGSFGNDTRRYVRTIVPKRTQCPDAKTRTHGGREPPRSLPLGSTGDLVSEDRFSPLFCSLAIRQRSLAPTIR